MNQANSEALGRKERERERHRAEILKVAEEVFAAKGYVSASMEEVAEKAEFSVGTLYNFFKSKEELYSAILHEKMEIMEARLRNALKEGNTPLEKIRRYIYARFDLLWENWSFFRLFSHHTMGTVFDPRIGFTPDVMERYEAFLDLLNGIFEQGIAQGQFLPIGARLLNTSLEGMICFYNVRLLRSENPRRDREEEERLVELFLRGAAT